MPGLSDNAARSGGPTVSLVMSCFNRERYLGFAIDSVRRQTFNDLELVVWDDGSTDGSVDVARWHAARDSRVRVIAAEHRGWPHGLAAAVQEVHAPLLGCIDSDDMLAPEALAKTVAVLQSRPEVGLVYTAYRDMGEDGTLLGTGFRSKIRYSPMRLLVSFMTFHFRLMRRSVFDQAGGINTEFLCANDYDLCLRMSEIAGVSHVSEPLYFYRHHEQTISHRNRERQIQFSLMAIKAALIRRGLAGRLDVHVNDRGQFSLTRRRD